MALTNALTLEQNVNGIDGIITDTTSDYGVSGNPARGTYANYLLYSNNDEDGNRNYYSLSTSLPLSQMFWNISIDVVGWTQATLLHITIWANAVSYVEEIKDGNNIITQFATIKYYTPTNKVYKCILAHTSSSTNAPDGISGTTYWIEVTDFSILVDYETVDQFTEDFMIDLSINTCVSKGFIDSCGCKDLKDLEPAIKNWALYMSGVANFNNAAPEKMDKIMNQLKKVCSTC